MKKFNFLQILFLLALLTLCIAGCANCKGNPQKIEYEVKFFIDGEKYSTQYCKFGEKIEPPEPEERSGFIFKGWYTDTDYIEKWDFANTTIKSNTSLYGYWTTAEEETFNVIFYDGNEILNTEKILNGYTVTEFLPKDKDGYTFSGWYNEESIFDFSEAITTDIKLSAKWEIIDYTIKFIAENEIIGEFTVNVENKSVTPPEVPEKLHYRGEWSEFEFSFEDIEVNAVYVPISYKAMFVADDSLVYELTYTVEDEIDLPDVPDKYGYEGRWNNLPFTGGDITISAEYTPIDYIIRYIIDDKTYKEIVYNVETEEIVPPDVPEKQGYAGKWDNVEIVGNVNIQAVYTPINYKATFIADETVVSVCEFNVENKNITVPPVLSKAGYTGEWEEFELLLEDIEIEAIYTPIQYKATYVIDGIEISYEYFTLDDSALKNLPVIPERQGYYSEWQNYSLSANNIVINAVYTPITYFVTFIADNNIIEKVPYTIKNTDIEEPAPPEKTGYDVYWKCYTLTYGDITVEAETVKIDSDIVYTLKSDGTYEVTKYLNDATPAKVVIPYKHNGCIVTSIKNEAFAQPNITEIILPDSINEIGAYAFAYTQLQTITLPRELTEISEYLFFRCESLENLLLGNNICSIGKYAFAFCSALKSIAIPASVTAIGTNAFKNCNALTEIKFENPEEWIFYDNSDNPVKSDCSDLEDVSIAAAWLTKTYVDYILKRQ